MTDKKCPVDLETFKIILKTHKLKATPQRIAVHRAMLALGHASADMVCDEITGAGEKITVASVYNILTQLALLGVYRHRFSTNNKMYFDVNTSRHIHLYDTYNHCFKDVFDDEIFEAIDKAMKNRRFKGYKIDGLDLQILCHPSRKKTTVSL